MPPYTLPSALFDLTFVVPSSVNSCLSLSGFESKAKNLTRPKLALLLATWATEDGTLPGYAGLTYSACFEIADYIHNQVGTQQIFPIC